MILSDMEVLDRRIQKTTKNLKGDKSLQKELDILKRVADFLEKASRHGPWSWMRMKRSS